MAAVGLLALLDRLLLLELGDYFLFFQEVEQARLPSALAWGTGLLGGRGHGGGVGERNQSFPIAVLPSGPKPQTKTITGMADTLATLCADSADLPTCVKGLLPSIVSGLVE